jgi:hypothetical protein
MPSVPRLPAFEQRHSIEELIPIRRDMLRYAHSPGGSPQSAPTDRLIARALFKNKDGLDAHTWEGPGQDN